MTNLHFAAELFPQHTKMVEEHGDPITPHRARVPAGVRVGTEGQHQ